MLKPETYFLVLFVAKLGKQEFSDMLNLSDLEASTPHRHICFRYSYLDFQHDFISWVEKDFRSPLCRGLKYYPNIRSCVIKEGSWFSHSQATNFSFSWARKFAKNIQQIFACKIKRKSSFRLKCIKNPFNKIWWGFLWISNHCEKCNKLFWVEEDFLCVAIKPSNDL